MLWLKTLQLLEVVAKNVEASPLDRKGLNHGTDVLVKSVLHRAKNWRHIVADFYHAS